VRCSIVFRNPLLKLRRHVVVFESRNCSLVCKVPAFFFSFGFPSQCMNSPVPGLLPEQSLSRSVGPSVTCTDFRRWLTTAAQNTPATIGTCWEKSHHTVVAKMSRTPSSLLDAVVRNGEGLVGTLILLPLDCLFNKTIVALAFADLLITGLCELHLFNGYMSDDHLLQTLCLLNGSTGMLRTRFLRGAQRKRGGDKT